MARHPGKCVYCGKVCEKDVDAHERFCKVKQKVVSTQNTQPPSIAMSPPADPNTKEQNKGILKRAWVWVFGEKKKEIITEEQKREKKIHWAYKAITILFIISGILQYVIFDFFRINKWLLLIVYVVDLLIYAFLMWTIWRLRKKQEIVVFENIEDFIEQVPKWCLDEKAPNKGIIGHILNAGKEYKQIVLVSKNFEPKKIWSEWNGFQFSIKERAYKPPNGSIRGDIFFYNMDKMCPLIDTVEVTSEDAEDSFQLDAVWNQAFAVGHAAAMSKTQGQIQLILILVAVCVGLILILGIYTYGQFGQVHDEIRAVHTIVANTSQMMQQNQVIVHN
jgi:hypothetical protein